MPADDEPKAGPSWERYRGYLLMLARSRLMHVLPGKFDASDVVQETLLKAHAHQEQFRGQSEGEWRAWLRQILANTLADALRDRGREPKILEVLEKSSLRLEAWLAAEHTSSSGHVEREERLIQLADAFTTLADDERTALELRYLHDPRWSLAQIAEHLNRPTAKAVAGILARGLEKLREVLRDPA
jgi:RNA polymerase sigma-70 factor (ECF subfamily)